ncbi:hypothetical protein HW115_19175 [Verrucomicrobiaceae bacterium N1E253]|uniref:Uncharacterized protein n=1 Tax=Oceaniferula marina TaxID=2748318 RepID=A0A851GKT5_9BACT|nr:DUF6584 family protein [Oceaniferula marina]NWK57749.1 hypothetical protein [Oceaniferula marina]
MPVEKTIEKARVELDAGNVRRAKEILRSSLGNYGYSPRLFRAYADVLLALDEPAQAGRYLFFSIDILEDEHRAPVEAFLAKSSTGGYKSILMSSPSAGVSRLSELPEYSRRKLEELGAPEDLSKVYSDAGGWWVATGCALAAAAVISLSGIGLWTVIRWIIN